MEQMVWLTVASIMPPNYQNESFYYDAKEREFFILTMFDYLLVDESKKFDFQYSEDEKSRLIDKINRIDNQDSSLIEIPRLTIEKRKDLQMNFVAMLNGHELQNELYHCVNNQTSSHQLILDEKFPSLQYTDSQLVDKWDTFKAQWMQKLAEDFENSFLVPLNEISIWKIEVSRAVKKIAVEKVEYAKKPFWKLW